MLTKKGKYGLKAVIYLASRPTSCWVLTEEIAAINQIPRSFLEGILRELRNAGVLNAKKGKGGGYMLSRLATTITVGEVIRILDGPIEPIACAGRSQNDHCEDCPDKSECPVQSIMRDVAAATRRIVDGKTLADVVMGGSGMWALLGQTSA